MFENQKVWDYLMKGMLEKEGNQQKVTIVFKNKTPAIFFQNKAPINESEHNVLAMFMPPSVFSKKTC